MSPVASKVFMFTGALSIVRREAQAIVSELDGVVGGSVNKRTDYLVVGEDYGSKFTTAQILGVKCIDEDEFWAMVNLAREETGMEILLSEEELEDFDSISSEKWKYVFSKNPNLLIATEEGFLDLTKKREVEVEPPRVYPPRESMSYYSRENLEKWLQSDSTKPKLGRRVCPYCGYEIPYSISSTHWYCFKCGVFSSIDQVEGRHVCTNWTWLVDTERGFGEKCNICGNVRFVGNDEVISNAESSLRCNFVHSLEFAAEVVEYYAEFDRNAKERDEQEEKSLKELQASFSPEKAEKLFNQFKQKEESKDTKYKIKKKRRDDRLAKKRAANQPI